MIRNFTYILILAVCTSCSLTRTIPENAHLYRGAKVKIVKTDKKIDTKKLKNTYATVIKQPRPNKSFLGIHWKLHNYNNHFNKQKKKSSKEEKEYGEPPVLYDEQAIEQVEILLANKAFNNGFFNTKVSKEVKRKRKRAWVKYLIEIAPPYEIDTIQNKVANEQIKKEIEKNQSNTLLQNGQAYNLPLLKKERQRITQTLRQAGYYFFREGYLKFRADTIQKNRKVSLELALKEDIDTNNLVPQTVGEIYVFPNTNQTKGRAKALDTIDYEGLTIIYSKEFIKPAVLGNAITFRKGDLYSMDIYQQTLKRLTSLQNFQFIDIQFKPSSTTVNTLITTIQLTPRKSHAIEGALGSSIKTNFYFGPEVTLSYLHRNLFKGGEQFRLTTFGNFNFPLNDRVSAVS